MQVNFQTPDENSIAYGLEVPPRKGDLVMFRGVEYVVENVEWELDERGVRVVTCFLADLGQGSDQTQEGKSTEAGQ